MSHRFYALGLHKTEWERLKKQGGPLVPKTSAVGSREEYFDALNEQSKKWISLWPDSPEGVREKLKIQRRKQRKDDIALVDAFRKSSNYKDTQAAVRQAKQMIFDDSCYGRQLISAVTESNILAEREVQIQFQKEIKQKETDLEKNNTYGDSPFVSRVDDDTMKANRKLEALECVKFNQVIELLKKEQAAKLKAEKIMCESVDEEMVKNVLEAKAKKKAQKKLCEKKGVEEYEAIRHEIEKHRKISEDHNNALIKAHKKDQDRMRCKIDAVLKNIIEESRHGERAIKFYKVIEDLQKAENKRYENFVEKGIEMFEKRKAMNEATEIDKENKRRAEQRKISAENKIAGANKKLQNIAISNKRACNDCTLLLKHDQEKQLSDQKYKAVAKPDTKKNVQDYSEKYTEDNSKEDKLSFLKPCNKLVQALKRREKESSGYTGTEGADKYFAQQASDALQRSQHKCFARKVVDEYLKVNHLESSALSISNYY